ncbi:MAG: hypothetical protein ACMG50_02600 [Thermomonas sp.]
MKDNFAELEEPRSKGPLIVLLAFGLMGVVFAYRLLSSPSHPIQGVVESIDAASAVTANGSSAGDVSVRLTDGSVVHAQAASGGSLHVGEQVRVMEQPASATGPAYEAIAIHPTER